MRFLTQFASALLLVVANGWASVAVAQQPNRCAPSIEASQEYAIDMKHMMASNDSSDIARFLRWQLPVVDSSAISVVTSGSVCDSLYATYIADLFAQGGGPDAVYVIAVGDYFLVWSCRRFPNSEFIPVLIVSPAFSVVSRVVM
jgi:hypothetical protein